MDDIHFYATQLRDHMHDRFDHQDSTTHRLYDHSRQLVESIEMKKDYRHIHDQIRNLEHEIHNVRNTGVFNDHNYSELYRHTENMRRQIEIMKLQGRLH